MMKLTLANQTGGLKKSRAKERARILVAILLLISFLLGIWVTVIWFQFGPNRPVKKTNLTNLSPANTQPVAAQPAEQVIHSNRPSRPFVEQPVPVAPEAIEEVKRALPNYASLSIEQGTEILRQATLKKFAAAVNELQSQVTKAQEELKLAENKSPAEQQAAMKHLQQVQAEQSEKLRQIGGRLQAQIAALKQLKATTQ